jgi:hypothetical protein
VVDTYGLPAERLFVISRGGVASWYGNMAARYADVFSYFSTDEFRAGTTLKKQREVGAFDAAVVRRIVAEHDLGASELLHPGLMYRLLMPFWKEQAPSSRVDKYLTYRPLEAPDDPVLRELPAEYVAVRFYFSDCFPDTAANRAFVSSTIDALSRQAPVVLLNTPFAVDDHRDAEAPVGRVHTISAQMTLERNLAVQTAVVARAKAFVGSYGGYSYLAPFYGVPSLAFFSDRTFKTHHLHVAQRVFDRLGGPSLVALDVADLPLVRHAMTGTRDAGPGTGDSGLGTGDSGLRARESGPDSESRIPDPGSRVETVP